MRVEQQADRLVISSGSGRVWIEAWGTDGLRVRMTQEPEMDAHDWALAEQPAGAAPEITRREVDMTDPWYREDAFRKYHRTGWEYTYRNGRISAKINAEGWISFYNQKGELLTEEYWRNRDRICRYSTSLRIPARELKAIPGTSDYALTARFEAFDDEMIFGMGQYQDRQLNKKGSILELCHRNSQASIPFFISSRGYGFLWNNPAIGTCTFGANRTEWTARSTRKMDYYITCGDTPAEIEEHYTAAVGRAPMMPEYGMGYWQCKLRYRTQEELLTVARRHKAMGLPLDAIVVDFFHWTRQGDFKFEPLDWPDPDAMVRELREMGVETVVSVWPTIDERSENYAEMADRGYLIRTDRGNDISTWMGDVLIFDATNPGAQRFVWEKCRENYYRKGLRCFWLDEAEPEYSCYEFDNYRYWAGPALQTSNIYPLCYTQGFYHGLREAGEKDILLLTRCGWVGSQKYGALIWSGDVYSSFRTMREQLQAGLSMAVAGIPWWTCDIGGFMGGDISDPAFRELLIRWFAWGCFSPVFRMHGERSPWFEREQEYRNGVRQLTSGQDNEVWSFGEENTPILARYLFIRERLRPYIREQMKAAHETGTPVMRPLFYDFPEDAAAWKTDDSYMFGPDLLVSPVMEAGVTERRVYLPAGARWKDAYTGAMYEGGREVTAPAPIDIIPVMIRDGKDYPIYL